MKEVVQDRYGNTIYLTEERWQHVIKRHPPLRNFRAEVLKTIRTGKRERSIHSYNKFLYRRACQHLPLPYSHIEVAVIFAIRDGQPNNFVVTAYPMIIG